MQAMPNRLIRSGFHPANLTESRLYRLQLTVAGADRSILAGCNWVGF